MIAAVGYLASVLLGISLIINNDLKFRWLNTFGCISFIVYGILINAFPIILTNSVLLLINLFYLVKIYRTEEDFDLVEFGANDHLIEKFVSFYRTDIASYFPGYQVEKTSISFVVLRDLVIANIFAADLLNDGTALVKINYTVSRYRDYKVGKFIFDKEKKFLVAKGVELVVYKSVVNKGHENFLKRMGFQQNLYEGSLCYTKSLL